MAHLSLFNLTWLAAGLIIQHYANRGLSWFYWLRLNTVFGGSTFVSMLLLLVLVATLSKVASSSYAKRTEGEELRMLVHTETVDKTG